MTKASTTNGTGPKPVFSVGDYRVDVTELYDENVPARHGEKGTRKVFVLTHEPSGVVAGYSQQLPGAIHAAVELNQSTLKTLADPYSLSDVTPAGRS